MYEDADSFLDGLAGLLCLLKSKTQVVFLGNYQDQLLRVFSRNLRFIRVDSFVTLIADPATIGCRIKVVGLFFILIEKSRVSVKVTDLNSYCGMVGLV